MFQNYFGGNLDFLKIKKNCKKFVLMPEPVHKCEVNNAILSRN